MDLPDLPTKLDKREAKITPRVNEWFLKNYPESVALEIKATKTGSIPKSAVKDHQLKALLAVRSSKGFSYKIPDSSHIRLPFDSFTMKNTQSFVVCVFLKHKVCLAFDPNVWDGCTPTTNPTFSIPLW